MYIYDKNPVQTTDEEQDKKIVAIALALPVFIIVIVLLRLLCFCVQKDSEEQDARGGNSRVAGQLAKRLLDDRAPSPTVAAVEVSLAVRAAVPPLA